MTIHGFEIKEISKEKIILDVWWRKPFHKVVSFFTKIYLRFDYKTWIMMEPQEQILWGYS